MDEETKDGKHRWPTEFICRLERHARPSATASPRDGMSGSRAPSLQEHDVIFGREVEQPSGRVRYEAVGRRLPGKTPWTGPTGCAGMD